MELKKDLEKYRNELIDIDKQILLLLMQRFELSEKTGAIKQKLNIETLQKTEWKKKMSMLNSYLKDISFQNEILDIFNRIHDASVKIQNRIAENKG